MPRHINDYEFDAPPTLLVLMTIFGGIITGLGVVLSLEYLGDRLSPNTSFLPIQAVALNTGLTSKQESF